LNIENLQRALDRAESPGMRRRLIAASRLLSKWERLEFLLTQYPKVSNDECIQLDEAVKSWIVNANRSHAIPISQRRSTVVAALDAARNMHPSRLWQEVLHLLQIRG